MEKNIQYINKIKHVIRRMLDLKEFKHFKAVSILREGSDREFYRVSSGRKSLVLMIYQKEKLENNYYCGIAEFLRKLSLPVPEILYYDKKDCAVLMEDLGDVSLFSFSKGKIADDSVRRIYEDCIIEISKLHKFGRDEYRRKKFPIMDGFDYNLYRWESGYFHDNLIKDYFKIKLSAEQEKRVVCDFDSIAVFLSKEKTGLVHRDFQSKNIMIRNKRPHFIDFQGMRYGIPFYDIASLLFDPYMKISEKHRCRLITTAKEIYRDEFREELFYHCALTRLLQALGAYGFLSMKKGKTGFIPYIKPGLKNMKEVLNILGKYGSLKNLISDLQT